jgi:diguanylate cyclase (GGDEF)-like protein/PAS domain S-box-containing protein
MPETHEQADEQSRIQLLHSLNLLDSEPEPVFDHITGLLSKALDMPIALVSLVDTGRQWFKSAVGLAVRETPREFAFCAHAIRSPGMMLVQDALQDPRFAHNPLVLGAPGIRFYAGMPLLSREGHALGTLCAMDSRPRELSDTQVQILDDLARLVTRELHFREAALMARSQLAQADLQATIAEQKFQALFENAGSGMALIAPNGRWLRANKALCGLLGYSAEELFELTFRDLTYAEDLAGDLVLLEQLIAGDIERYELEKRYIRHDRSPVWVHLTVTQHLNAQGHVEYFLTVINDIQARKASEAALATLAAQLEERVAERTRELQQREAELMAILEYTNDAYVCLDQEGVINVWNRKAEETFGWSRDEVLGRVIDEVLVPPALRKRHRQGMRRYLDTREPRVLGTRLELPALCKDGRTILVELHIHAIHLQNKTIFNAFLHEITARKEREVTLERQALQDPLTGLPNRRALMEDLPTVLARTRARGDSLALLFIDLDGFKQVNDTFGHEAGDQLLETVAQRLKAAVRATDVVYRLAGDEFTVLLRHVQNLGHARVAAEKVLQTLNRPLELAADLLHVQASIGVCLFNQGLDCSAADLLKQADAAMYTAKRSGRNRIHVLDPTPP